MVDWHLTWTMVQAIAAIFIALGIGFAGIQAKAVRKSTKLQALNIVLTEFGSEEHRAARRYVIEQFRTDAAEKNVKTAPDLDNLGPCKRKKVEMVLASFNRVGFILCKKMIDKKDLIEFIGGPAMDLWEQLKDYVLAERARRKEKGRERNYGEYFQRFAETSKQHWQKNN